MVQKSFLAFILADIEVNFHDLQANRSQARYHRDLMEELAANNFKDDSKTMALLLKKFGSEWKDKCERSLLLAKQLGNIYTGSLYNGLLSLICDDQIDLAGKQVCMFSYGSGCAASMFVLRFSADYHRISQLSNFKERLASRVKVTP
jgi:hydroxymethylglutaryl-CoA synthase